MFKFMHKEEQVKYLKNVYGFDFPLKCKYKRFENRVYFADDFQDGEEIQFNWMCGKPSSNAKGYAFYSNRKGRSKLISINDIVR